MFFSGILLKFLKDRDKVSIICVYYWVLIFICNSLFCVGFSYVIWMGGGCL